MVIWMLHLDFIKFFSSNIDATQKGVPSPHGRFRAAPIYRLKYSRFMDNPVFTGADETASPPN
jgi:hypothetical protein